MSSSPRPRAAARVAWVAVALVAVAVVFSWPLWSHSALPLGSDLAFASQSAHGFTEALREGVAYPRWIDRANKGLGAPTFVFYPPLAYYAIAVVSWATGGDVLAALRVVLTLLALLSGVTMYLAARDHASRGGATIAAVLYVLFPYHVLDLYDRFAVAELAAFCWYPLVFLFAERLLARRSAGACLGTILCYAGLIATHLVSALMLPIVLAPYVALRLREPGAFKGAVALLACGLLALLCCAGYLAPLLAQRDLVELDCVTGGPNNPWCAKFDWRGNFLFRDETARGFPEATLRPVMERTALSQTLPAIVALVLLFARRRSAARASSAAIGWAAVALWTLLLQTPLSWPVWATVPEIANVQFPWRFAGFQALAACVLVARAVDLPARRPWLPLAVMLAAALPAVVLSLGSMDRREFGFDATLAADPKVAGVVMYEYLPRLVDWPSFESLPPRGERQDAYLTAEGSVRVLSWSSHRRTLEVDTPAENRLTVATFAYPGWRAAVDGAPVPIGDDNPYRAISIDVAPGRHLVELAFGSTPDRRNGAGVGLASLAAVLLAWGFVRGRRLKLP
jgi:hypothetical protein